MLRLLKKRHNKRHLTGFTIIEVLLSVVIMSMIAGVGIPIYQSFQNRNELDIASVSITQSLRRAQVLAQAVDGDTAWGLYVQSGSITLYKGNNFIARDTGFDEDFQIPTNITISGTQEYVFSKFTGEPLSTGVITLTSVNNESRTITVNEKGMIDY